MSDSNDLLLRVLRGERTERRPLWIMRQAGRCLPEYRALRRAPVLDTPSRAGVTLGKLMVRACPGLSG